MTMGTPMKSANVSTDKLNVACPDDFDPPLPEDDEDAAPPAPPATAPPVPVDVCVAVAPPFPVPVLPPAGPAVLDVRMPDPPLPCALGCEAPAAFSASRPAEIAAGAADTCDCASTPDAVISAPLSDARRAPEAVDSAARSLASTLDKLAKIAFASFPAF